MWANIFVAFTNLPVILPIYLTIVNHDYWTMAAVAFVGLASFISHLVENHKHGMPGIGFSPKVSYILNRFDVLGCILVGLRLGYLYLAKYGLSAIPIINNIWLVLIYCSAFVLLFTSEYDRYNPDLKPMYIVMHSLWHICIFLVVYSFLAEFIY